MKYIVPSGKVTGASILIPDLNFTMPLYLSPEKGNVL